MWKSLALQSLVFFLFFQPQLLARRRIRYLVLAFGLLVMAALWRFENMDPFAWAYSSLAVLATYWTANKALRWIFVNREFAGIEAKRLVKLEDRTREKTARKEARIRSLQQEIQRVSDLYESVKEMSATLELLDLFVTLSEALIKNVAPKKVRLVLFKPGSRMPERVLEADAERLESAAGGRSMTPRETIFAGEKYPSDARLAEVLAERKEPVEITAGDATGPGEALMRSPGSDTLIALPVATDSGLEAALTVEGAGGQAAPGIFILCDRFSSEFRRIRLYEDVQRLATTDWLTGLYVRRYFFKRLEEEISRCQRFNLKFCFLMIDLDDFKTYNDRYGHFVGDALLKQAAAIIRQSVREGDLVARYGGEEFAAILLDTDTDGAMFVGQRIRKSIEKEQFRVYDEEISITVSIGLAMYSPKIKEGGEIVEWADAALYQAKKQGKNRVCAYANT